MFGLSGGSNKSRSSGSSQATSSSFGRGSSESVQGSQSASVSGGTSIAGSSGRSSQSIAFEDVFSRLFGNAEQTAANLDSSLLTQASNDLFGAGTDFLESLGGDAGSSFLTERLANRDTLEADQIAQLSSDIGEQFREEILPAITSEAVAGGQLGGGRQGVAEGIAAGEAADALSRGAVDIRTRNQAQLDALAAGIAERNVQGAQVGLAGATSLGSVAELGFGADLRGLQLLSGILGGPQALTQSEQGSFSTSEDFARAFSDSFGRSSSENVSGSESQSTSETSSRSKGRNAGIRF